MSVIGRDQYERVRARQLADQARTMEDFKLVFRWHYPKTTEAAIDELRFRGLDATRRRGEYYVARPGVRLRVASKIRLWYREDIDAFAAYLAEQGALTPSAMWRKEHGLTYDQEQQALARVARKEKA